MKVKLFRECNPLTIEEDINRWLEVYPNKDIKDIKLSYGTSNEILVLILYED